MEFSTSVSVSVSVSRRYRPNDWDGDAGGNEVDPVLADGILDLILLSVTLLGGLFHGC